MAEMGVGRVAAIGTGTIGASRAAYFRSRGLSVAASDPAPQGEAFLRGFVTAAWPTLPRLQPLPEAPPPDALSFHAVPEAAVAGGGGCRTKHRQARRRAGLSRF